MPRYDYVCQTCEHLFELKQGFDAETVATCPQCEGTSQRKIYAPPVFFKGSGFYVNDYGKGNGSKATSNNGASESKKEQTESSAKSESPDSKKDSPKTEAPKKAESTTPSTD